MAVSWTNSNSPNVATGNRKKLREEEEARQETVFGRAEKVRNDGKEREMVVLEVDGTLLHSQEKGEPKSIREGDARREKAVP